MCLGLNFLLNGSFGFNFPLNGLSLNSLVYLFLNGLVECHIDYNKNWALGNNDARFLTKVLI